jgi:hypothetical protein
MNFVAMKKAVALSRLERQKAYHDKSFEMPLSIPRVKKFPVESTKNPRQPGK